MVFVLLYLLRPKVEKEGHCRNPSALPGYLMIWAVSVSLPWYKSVEFTATLRSPPMALIYEVPIMYVHEMSILRFLLPSASKRKASRD